MLEVSSFKFESSNILKREVRTFQDLKFQFFKCEVGSSNFSSLKVSISGLPLFFKNNFPQHFQGFQVYFFILFGVFVQVARQDIHFLTITNFDRIEARNQVCHSKNQNYTIPIQIP
jgi:hypothetical protein